MKQSVTITGENLNVVMNGVVAANEAPARMMSKAEMRIATLKAKGIDTSCYCTLGTDQVVKIENGKAIPVEMMDEVEKKMVEGGYINHYTLFRRWVMSQMFRMLRKQEQDGCNFTELIQDHGYEYSWRVVERELNAQVKMLKHGDNENFGARNRWFNNETVEEMANQYIGVLKQYIDGNLTYRMSRDGKVRLWKHTCNGIPYVRFRGKNIFVKDLNRKVFLPLENVVRDIKRSSDSRHLYEAVVKFNSLRKKMKGSTRMSQWFINSYKGSGAYFTCKNLIMFHGATFRNSGMYMGRKKSLMYLEDKANEYSKSNEAWRMMGVLKQLIRDSDISISKKIDEWKK